MKQHWTKLGAALLAALTLAGCGTGAPAADTPEPWGGGGGGGGAPPPPPPPPPPAALT